MSQPESYAIDFAPFIKERATDFTGREWVFKAVDKWLGQPDSSRYFLLTGEPGSGKTAIAARLAQFSEGQPSPPADSQKLGTSFLSVVYFCRAAASDWIDPLTFARTISMQLTKITRFAEALKDIGDKDTRIEVKVQAGTVQSGGVVKGLVIENLVIRGLNGQEAFNRTVLDPLRTIYNAGYDRSVLILVDSLDEALTSATEVTIVDLLAGLQGLDPRVRLILTSRTEPRVENRFLGASGLFLSDRAYTAANSRDVLEYVTYRLEKDKELNSKVAALTPAQASALPNQITGKAEGNFQYVVFLLKSVAAGQQALDDLKGLPPGLDGLYYNSLDRVVKLGKKDWATVYKPLLGVLSVAMDPLAPEQLQTYAGLPGDAWDALMDLRQFVETSSERLPENDDEKTEDRYRLYHQSMVDFLRRCQILMVVDGQRKSYDNVYHVKAEDWHKRIVATYRGGTSNWDAVDWRQVDDYGFLYLAHHMLSAGEHNEVVALLTNFAFMAAKIGKIGVDSLLNDLQSVLRYSDLSDTSRLPLQATYRVLDATVVLRNWNSEANPSLFLDQLYLCATRMKELHLLALIEAHLRKRGQAYLQYLWTTVLDSPELERTFTGHRGSVVDVAITPDERTIVSQTNSGELRLWELETGREKHSPSSRLAGTRGRSPTGILLTKDSRYVIWNHWDSWLSICDLETGEDVNGMPVSYPWFAGQGKPHMWSIDSSNLLYWGSDGLQILSLTTGEKHALPIPPNSITAIAVMPDGCHLTYGAHDGAIHVWDLVKGEQSSTLRNSGTEVQSISITPDGQWLALADKEKRLQIWDMPSNSLKREMPLHFETNFVVTPEGDRVIFSYHDFSLKVWDLSANKLERTLRGHSAQINRIVLTSDGSRVISAADDGTVRIWNISGVSNKSPVRRRANSSHTSRISALAVTPDGEHALSGSVDGVTVWDLREGVAEQAFAEQDGWVDDIAISPDGHQATVVSSRGYGQFDAIISDGTDQDNMKCTWRYTWSGAQTVSVYDVMTGQRIHSAVFGLGDPEVVKRHEAAAVRELNQYGELSTYVPIMMTDTDGSVTGETKNTFLSHFKSEGGRARSIPQLDSLAHSIFRPTIAVDSGRLIHFERTADGLLVLQSDFQTPPTRVMFNYTGTIHPRAVTPDGRHLVLALDQGLLRVFDFRTNELTDGFQGHKAAVYQVAFTPNGQTALSLSEDGTCAIWDLHTREGGRHLKSTEPLEIKAVSADSRRALLVSPRLLVIVFPLEAGDKSAPHLLEGHTAIIHDVAVTPDGHRVVSVSEDCTLKIWSLDSGQELSSVTLDQPIHKVAFALDGEAIIMGDAVGNIYCLRYMG